jgi:hypothetical protein
MTASMTAGVGILDERDLSGRRDMNTHHNPYHEDNEDGLGRNGNGLQPTINTRHVLHSFLSFFERPSSASESGQR